MKPINLSEANAFVACHHRHHGSARGHKFSIGLFDDADQLIGVAIVGRPVARAADDGLTAEVVRLCTVGAYNACSMLYAACWRAAKGMGYRRMITYTLADEGGASLRAAGWLLLGRVRGRSWHCPSRPRTDKHPTCDKSKWGIGDVTQILNRREPTYGTEASG